MNIFEDRERRILELQAEIARLQHAVALYSEGSARLELANKQSMAIADARSIENAVLRAALAWIDNTDPEMVAAAEAKFGFKLIVEQ